MTEKKTIIKYMKSAIKLGINSKLMGLDTDYKDKEGGKIIYVIDNNIYDLFTNPKENSKQEVKKRNEGTGEIFPEDKPETKISLTKNIGGYLFSKESPKDLHSSNSLPFLMFADTVQGLSKYLFALINKIINESETAETLIKKKLEEFSPEDFQQLSEDERIEKFDGLVKR
jgi:hypothetical protein